MPPADYFFAAAIISLLLILPMIRRRDISRYMQMMLPYY